MRGQSHAVEEIATTLCRHSTTIRRELKRNCCAHDGFYRAMFAVQKANGRRSRSRRNKRYTAEHFAPIERMLREDLSPKQIVGRLRAEGLCVMSIETLYLHIWEDRAKGGTLWLHLRGAHKRRRKRYARKDSRGRLAGKRMITDRPPIVAERSRLGDWEIDTVRGRGKPATVTVVERKSGLVRIGKLPRVGAQETLERTTYILRNEPHPIHTITADNGTEFHMYKALEQRLQTTIYFANPHHAWERGTNENTNGLLRQYFPKKHDLQQVSRKDMKLAMSRLNFRPRKSLRFKTPFEVFYHSSVALTS
jgi:IS30 family transposase